MSNKTTITAGVTGGTLIKTTSEGLDPDFENISGLIPDCQYLRLKNVDGSYAYIALSEIDSLRNEIKNKASNIDIELMQSDIDEKATKSQLEEVRNLAIENSVDDEIINTMLASIENKAEQSVVNGIANELLNKADSDDVQSLTTLMENKASKKSVDDLIKDVNTLKKTLGVLNDDGAIESIQNQINYLNSEINRRLTVDDIRPINLSVNSVSNIVSELNERVDEFESKINDTASAAGVIMLRNDVDDLINTVSRLESKLSTKADSSTLSSKASHDELLKVAERLTKLSNTIKTHETTHEDAINDINAILKNKLNVVDHTISVNTLNTKIDLKADKSVVSQQIQEIEKDCSTLKRQVEDIENTIDNTDYENDIISLNNSVKSLNDKLNNTASTTQNLSKDVDTIKSWKDTTSKQFKSQWVRVLSTKEYNSLLPAGDNVIQDYNARYKYPNTVYLIVDYNTPKAIYIGDILIAKAEIKGSTGFAYAFPFTFPAL